MKHRLMFLLLMVKEVIFNPLDSLVPWSIIDMTRSSVPTERAILVLVGWRVIRDVFGSFLFFFLRRSPQVIGYWSQGLSSNDQYI